MFKDSTPLLLGDGFTKNVKERYDELKCLSVPMPTIRPCIGSVGLYQDYEAHNRNTQIPRPENDSVYR